MTRAGECNVRKRKTRNCLTCGGRVTGESTRPATVPLYLGARVLVTHVPGTTAVTGEASTVSSCLKRSPAIRHEELLMRVQAVH